MLNKKIKERTEELNNLLQEIQETRTKLGEITQKAVALDNQITGLKEAEELLKKKKDVK